MLIQTLHAFNVTQISWLVCFWLKTTLKSWNLSHNLNTNMIASTALARVGKTILTPLLKYPRTQIPWNMGSGSTFFELTSHRCCKEACLLQQSMSGLFVDHAVSISNKILTFFLTDSFTYFQPFLCFKFMLPCCGGKCYAISCCHSVV